MKNTHLTHTRLISNVFIFLCLSLSSTLLQAQICSAPSNLTSKVFATNSATLSWAAIPGALNYTVEYRIGNTVAWTSTGASSGTSRTITNLQPETVYTWRVKANCSVFSSVATFNSGGDTGGNASCSQPSNLTVRVLSPTSVVLGWSISPGAFYYTVQYRVGSTGVWQNRGSITSLSTTLTGLTTGIEYQWRVKSSCSSYSSITSFNTSSSNSTCSQPSNTNATNITNTSARLTWSAIQGAQNYTVQYRKGLTGTYLTAGTVTTTALTLSGLTLGTEYSWRVKASCSDYSSQAVFTTTGAVSSTCSQPSNTNATNITNTSARLTWSAIQGAQNYTVQYRKGLTGTYLTAGTVTTTALTLSGLTLGTEYSWRVKASCSDYSSQAVFTTTGTGGGGPISTSCSSPSNTDVVAIFTTSANIQWEPQGGALNYTVQYRRKNTLTYTTLGTFTGSTATLSGLTPNTEYEWRVKANCSPYGSDVSFTTLASLALVRNSVQTSVASVKKMSVFPNPVYGDEITIKTDMEGGQIQIINYAGQVVLNKVTNSPQEQINIVQLNKGLYIVRVRFEDGTVESNKLIISH